MARPLRRKAAAAILGLAALAVAAVFAGLKACGKTEADLLLDVMVSGDRADAAWAFERLKAIAPSAIDDLIARVDDPSPTVLEDAEWVYEAGGSSSIADDPLTVKGLVRFILCFNLGAGSDEGFFDVDQRYSQGEMPPLLRARIEERRCSAPERTIRWLRRIVSPSPRIVPPSRDPAIARHLIEGEAMAFLADLEEGDGPLAYWSVEALKTLDDDSLTTLFPLAWSEKRTIVATLNWPDHGMHMYVHDGCTVGNIVRNVLETRLGWRIDPWAGPYSYEGHDPGLLDAAWKRYLEGKDPGPPPGEG